MQKKRKWWHLGLLPILLCIVAGCRSSPAGETVPVQTSTTQTSTAPVYAPVVIKSGIENGRPVGIRLSIQKTTDTDTTTAYTLISSYGDKPIGLILVVPREGVTKRARMGAFKSLGPASDLFLQILANQYEQKIDSAAKFTDSAAFTLMNLKVFFKSDSAKEGDWIAADYKLFFDSESIDGDAEIFMNINIDHNWVEFPEKDEEYRSHLIHLFKRKN